MRFKHFAKYRGTLNDHFNTTNTIVQQAAAKAVYERKFLLRGESEEFGDVVFRFFLGDNETMSVGEMFALERGGSLMKVGTEVKNRKNRKASQVPQESCGRKRLRALHH